MMLMPMIVMAMRRVTRWHMVMTMAPVSMVTMVKSMASMKNMPMKTMERMGNMVMRMVNMVMPMVNMEHMENMVMDMGMKARSEIDEYLENSSTMSTMKSLSQLVVAVLQHTMYLNLKSSAHPD